MKELSAAEIDEIAERYLDNTCIEELTEKLYTACFNVISSSYTKHDLQTIAHAYNCTYAGY